MCRQWKVVHRNKAFGLVLTGREKKLRRGLVTDMKAKKRRIKNVAIAFGHAKKVNLSVLPPRRLVTRDRELRLLPPGCQVEQFNLLWWKLCHVSRDFCPGRANSPPRIP